MATNLLDDPIYKTDPDAFRTRIRKYPEARQRTILSDSRRLLERGRLQGIALEDLSAVEQELFPPVIPPPPEPGILSRMGSAIAAPFNPEAIAQRQAEGQAATAWEQGPALPTLPEVPQRPDEGLLGRAFERITTGQGEALKGQQAVVEQTPGLREFSRAYQDLLSGTIGTVGGVVQTPALLESLMGQDTSVGEASQRASSALKQVAQGLQPPDPAFVDKLISGIGSTGPLILPGVGAARLATSLFGFSPRAASWIGATAAALPETMVEGTQTYQELLDKGMSKQEAAGTAKWVMAANGVLLPLTNKLGFFGDRGRWARQLIMTGLMEGGQEGAQGVIQRLAVEGGIKAEDAGAIAEEFLVGATIGTLFKGAQLGGQRLREGQVTPEPEPMPTPEGEAEPTVAPEPQMPLEVPPSVLAPEAPVPQPPAPPVTLALPPRPAQLALQEGAMIPLPASPLDRPMELRPDEAIEALEALLPGAAEPLPPLPPAAIRGEEPLATPEETLMMGGPAPLPLPPPATTRPNELMTAEEDLIAGGPVLPPQPIVAPEELPLPPGEGETPEVPVGTVRKNNRRQGVELKFSTKPPLAVRQQLHKAGFKWDRAKSQWYAPQTPENEALARRLAKEAQVPEMPARPEEVISSPPELSGAPSEAAPTITSLLSPDLQYIENYKAFLRGEQPEPNIPYRMRTWQLDSLRADARQQLEDEELIRQRREEQASTSLVPRPEMPGPEQAPPTPPVVEGVAAPPMYQVGDAVQFRLPTGSLMTGRVGEVRPDGEILINPDVQSMRQYGWGPDVTLTVPTTHPDLTTIPEPDISLTQQAPAPPFPDVPMGATIPLIPSTYGEAAVFVDRWRSQFDALIREYDEDITPIEPELRAMQQYARRYLDELPNPVTPEERRIQRRLGEQLHATEYFLREQIPPDLPREPTPRPTPPPEPDISLTQQAPAPEPIPALPVPGAEALPALPTVEAAIPEPAATASQQVANWVRGQLNMAGEISSKTLFGEADKAFGGTQAQGTYTPKDAYDAMELGVNQYLMENAQQWPNPADEVDSLRRLIQKLPTQTRRTGEQENFQQFSTPPHLAYLAAHAANLQPSDVVLEPSAGIGGLAIFARRAGARTIVNELSPRRAELLKQMGFDQVFNENAEQLHNILPPEIKPTVVLMNPPFSASAGRLGEKTSNTLVRRHLEQALSRLEPNGRLVAILGRGMADDRPTTRGWWNTIKDQYDVRINLGLPGKEYAKYGTTFDNQIVVIDKTGPTPPGRFSDRVESLEEALPLLEGIRNDRATAGLRPPERPSGEPARQETPGIGGGVTGSELPVPPAAVPVGATVGGGGAAEGPVSLTTGQPGSDVGMAPVSGPSLPPGPDVGGGRDLGIGSPAVPGPGEPRPVPTPAPLTETPTGEPALTIESQLPVAEVGGDISSSIYEAYTPQKLRIPGAKPHPGKLVQSAAMASVEPPNPTYTPKLPKGITERLSIAQLEAVTYAGQAHKRILPNGNRQGYYVGDSTGVGKGREISGILLDNMAQGRTKAVWISTNGKLFNDAKRDFGDTGGDIAQLFDLSKVQGASDIKAEKGIAFTTYSTLRSGAKQARDQAGNLVPGQKRLDQLVKWLGEDFDGLIAFDEAHLMANALQQKGTRGIQRASAQAMAGLDLQQKLPKARVIYVSATGATEVSNLAYAERLGLWGQGTPFANVQAFVTQIHAGGLAAMELVARDLKARGLYISRGLSFDDVTYETLEHPLTADQRVIYDKLVEAWQIVLQNVNEALQLTASNDAGTSVSGAAKSAAMSAFWGSHQRFFNQIITSLQMPSVVARLRQDLANGQAAVLQLVNTNEAMQERRLAEIEEELTPEALASLDMTPRDNLMQYIQNSFPVAQYETYIDDNGNERFRQVLDANGNPVQNADAVAMREQLLDELGSIRVPEGALEILLNTFGPDVVAEVTGRSRRVVRVSDAEGERTEVQRRGETAALADARAFMDDRKQILVFSDAGGTGQSYHASLTVANQRKRQHYLVQPGWRADRAVQGMGRTHRTNEASAPNYLLVTTDLKGQKRFLSSIARRLDQLGALTKGQRQTGGQGLFSEKDNLESQYAQDAMRQFWIHLANNRLEGLDFTEVTAKMGLDLIDKQTGNLKPELPTVTQFLNRILSLNIDLQNQVFDGFFDLVERQVANAIAAGTLDVGVETVKALKTDVVSEQTVYTDPDSGAESRYVHLQLTHPRKITSWEQINEALTRKGPDFLGYFLNEKSGRISAVIHGATRTSETGAITETFISSSPTSLLVLTQEDVSRLQRLEAKDAQRVWTEAAVSAPTTYTEEMHIITGAILPIWDRMPGKTRVVRLQSSDGRRFLGRFIAPGYLQQTLQNLGAASSAPQITPEEAVKKILDDRYTMRLANGWTIKQARVSGEPRIEITGPGPQGIPYSDMQALVKEGAFMERIRWETRVFLPTGPDAATIFGAVTQYRPIVSVEPPVRSADDVLAAQRQAESSADQPQAASFEPELPTPDVSSPPPQAQESVAPEQVEAATLIPPSLRRPTEEGTAPEAPKPSQILKDLEKALNLPMRTGRLRRLRRFSIGQYSPHSKMVRLRLANDVEAAGHEIGHFLQHSGAFDAIMTQHAAELEAMAPLGYPPDQDLNEGFAEFVRYFITHDTEAQGLAQGFYQAFDPALRDLNPQWYDAIMQARSQYTDFVTASPSARIGAVLSVGETKTPGKGIPHWWHEFYRAMLDDLHWVKVARDVMSRGVGLDPLDDAYLLGRLLRGVNGKIGNMLRHGMVKFEDIGTRVSKGLPDILAPWADDLANGEASTLRRYLLARGALEAIANAPGRTVVPISREDAEATIRETEQSFPKIKQTFTDLRTFEDGALNYVRDAGMLSDETFAKIQAMHREHMPLYRVMEEPTPLETSVFGGGATHGTGAGGTKVADVSSPVRRRRGSGRDIIDPLESIIKNTYLFIAAADRNNVMRALTDQAEVTEGFGNLIFPLPTPTVPTSIEVAEIQKALTDAGIDVPPGTEDALLSIWRPNYAPQQANAAWVWQKGQRKLYELAPELYRSVEAMDQESVSLAMKILSAPAQALRLGATQLNPAFMIRNPGRDMVSAWVNSGTAVVKGLIPVMHGMLRPSARGRLRELYSAWELSGGAQASLVSMDRTDLQEKLDDLLRKGRWGKKMVHGVKHPVKTLKTLSEYSELLTRLSVFSGSLPKGGISQATTSEMLAAGLGSREGTIDFARHGAMTTSARRIVAFLNANAQGIDKLGRTLLTEGTPGDRAAAWMRVLIGITLPSIVLWAVNSDDEEYQQMPQWLKDVSWLFPIGNYYVPIPKPPLVGQFFGSVPERFLNWYMKKDPDGAKELRKTLLRGLEFSWIPTAIAPLVENYANHSLFFDRPIVPQSLENVQPRQQKSAMTSETAGYLARPFEMVESVPGVGQLASPAKLENLLIGYTGGLGRIGLNVGDLMLEQLGASEVKIRPSATTPLGDIPVLNAMERAVLVRNQPTGQSVNLQRFYEQLAEARTAETTMRHLIRAGRETEALALMNDPNQRTGRLDPLEATEKILRDQRGLMHQIYRSTTMTRQQKRQEIDKITQQMNVLAGQALALSIEIPGNRAPYKRWPKGAR